MKPERSELSGFGDDMDSEDKKKSVTEDLSETQEEAETLELPLFPTDQFVLFPAGMCMITVEERNRVNSIRAAMKGDGSIFILPLSDMHQGLPSSDELRDMLGLQANILNFKEKENGLQITLHGMRRMRLVNFKVSQGGIFSAICRAVADIPLSMIGETVYGDHALLRAVRQSARSYIETHDGGRDMKEILQIIDQSRDPGGLCDFLAGHLDMPQSVRLQLFQTLSIRHRLQILLNVFAAQNEAGVIFKNAAQKVRSDIDKQQREYFIRQHIKALREQIKDDEPDPSRDEDELVAKIKALDASDEVRTYVEKQYKRMSYLPINSAEYSVARTHIETLLDMPWNKKTVSEISLKVAREILDREHYGLEEVKTRVLEHLAVMSLRNDLKSPILCFYGPPGVGKTSIGKSIATALGRKFERISLGGIHDESEIRGHRRTYVGSMPGRIVQALRRAQSLNPVIMLDEIDKMSPSNQGDPASALLEVLDPAQNHAFVDNYIETPIDLSDVLFITTANSLDSIPGPLRDRMELIEIPSYTHVDKRCIAQEFLLPKVLKAHGLIKSTLSVSDDALDDIISYYTREAGVRQLEQKLSALCRKVASKVAAAQEEGKRRPHVSVTARTLEKYLGKRKYDFDLIEPDRLPGISTGLAWTPVGGDILFIETTEMVGKGNLVITGKLGDVMQESIRAAMTLIRSRALKLGLDADILAQRDIHVHVPAGAVPKDGPSAGVAIFIALLSLFKNTSVPATMAMTGEISLRGNVLPVGGIREKVLAAHRSGIRTILMPIKNKPDLDEIPQEVKTDIDFHFLKTIDDAVQIVFP